MLHSLMIDLERSTRSRKRGLCFLPISLDLALQLQDIHALFLKTPVHILSSLKASHARM